MSNADAQQRRWEERMRLNDVLARTEERTSQMLREAVEENQTRQRAYDAAVAKLRSIYSGQIPDSVAREIADAVLDVVRADRVNELRELLRANRPEPIDDTPLRDAMARQDAAMRANQEPTDRTDER